MYGTLDGLPSNARREDRKWLSRPDAIAGGRYTRKEIANPINGENWHRRCAAIFQALNGKPNSRTTSSVARWTSLWQTDLMKLTRSYRTTISNRVKKDPEFASALLAEAEQLLSEGERDASQILRDFARLSLKERVLNSSVALVRRAGRELVDAPAVGREVRFRPTRKDVFDKDLLGRYQFSRASDPGAEAILTRHLLIKCNDGASQLRQPSRNHVTFCS